MKNINIYCGWQRDTVIKVRPKILNDIVFEVLCLECNGTGLWDFLPEKVQSDMCIACKGTGRQYLGL